MELPPLLERELRVALRRQSPLRSRFWTTLAAGAGAAAVLLASAFVQSPGAGRTLFTVLVVFALVSIAGVPRAMAGAFAAERENQTLGLLMLSGLHPLEVLASKVVSALLVSTTLLLSLVPFLAVPFLAGGVSRHQFLAALVMLPNLLLLVTAISLLTSVVCADTSTAQFTARLALAVLVLAPLVIYFLPTLFSGVPPMSRWWLWAGPGFAPWGLVFSRAGTQGWFAGFWPCTWITFGWSYASLGTAAWALRRVWRAEETQPAETGWRRRWRYLLRGGGATGEQRRWLLDLNPFLWLAMRHRAPLVWSWMVIGGGSIGLVALCVAWPKRFCLIANLLLASALMVFTLSSALNQAAASTLAAVRRTGLLETLLTTPLAPGAMIWGQLEGLRRQFQPLWQSVLGIHCVLLTVGAYLMKPIPAAWAVYLGFCAVILLWHFSLRRESYARLLVIWLGLYTGRVRWSVWKAHRFLSSRGFWFIALVTLPVAARNWGAFPTGTRVDFALLGWFVMFGGVGWLESRQAARALSQRLLMQFREVAQEPIPAPDDPRLKHWKLDTRLPLDAARMQAELVERVVRRNPPARSRSAQDRAEFPFARRKRDA